MTELFLLILPIHQENKCGKKGKQLCDSFKTNKFSDSFCMWNLCVLVYEFAVNHKSPVEEMQLTKCMPACPS